ncbi:MAG: hypothetical protein PHE47_00220 [Oscillospiraceae bacterium]|nr:hypothetical protein [Oscillospiraceae bacterium]
MVRDVFIEEIVKKKKSSMDWVKITAIVLLCLGLAAGFLFLGMFFPFCWVLAGLSVYFGYFFITRRSIEFEYSLTNDTFDIDTIIAKRTRKRLISDSCKNFDDFGAYLPEEHTQKQYEKKIFACDSPKSENLWYFVAKGSSEGNTLVVFNGSERLIEAIKERIPRHMYQELFGRR